MDVDSAFQRTFKMLLGKGDGEVRLENFREYLTEYFRPVSKKKSWISGKDITLLTDEHCGEAKFISQDEIIEGEFKPLNINEIKDIDSLLNAIDDRVLYTGNRVLGESGFVNDVDVCMDSFYVVGSTNIKQSKYIAYSWMVRDSEYVFGSSTSGKARHMIKTVSYNSTRCFEAYYVADTSDTYFSYNCLGCTHNMFSLNQRGARYVIGNLPLEKDRYFRIRNKLLEEIREKLVKDKKLPNIFNLPGRTEAPPEINVKERTDEQRMDRIDKAFNTAGRITLGANLGPITRFEKWLSKHTATVGRRKTPFGRETYPPFSSFPFMRGIHESRFVTNEEALELGKLRIDLSETEELNLSVILKKIEKIAYYSPEIIAGGCQNVIGSPLSENSVNIYKVVDSNFGKNSGISGQVFNSEYVFGSFWIIDCGFCLNCYHSANLVKCFEMDGCSNCRDSMFCHNCENLSNCMFCFNAKNKRYAIGNVEFGREKYMQLRNRVLGWMVSQLEKEGCLGPDIYCMGRVK
ncbi:MAG: hypothetical protein ABIG39_06440 [Candidatus Micrarchaeota archaeon]